jgi:hypothetical protein
MSRRGVDGRRDVAGADDGVALSTRAHAAPGGLDPTMRPDADGDAATRTLTTH